MLVFSDQLTKVQVEEASEFLFHRCTFINAVDLVIQLGSGADSSALLDEEWTRFPLQQMPHMPTMDSIAKHSLEVIWGGIGGTRVLVLSGRFHVYEGYGRVPCLLPVFALAECGARNFLLVNAAGGIRNDLTPGSCMVLRDHINNVGVSALEGHQHLLVTPYIDMTDAYDEQLRESFEETAESTGLDLQSGVYLANHGPQFETPAEIAVAKQWGADAVGMSTVLEATAAYALGTRVVGVSMITNRAAGLSPTKITHEAHLVGGKRVFAELTATIRAWIQGAGGKLL